MHKVGVDIDRVKLKLAVRAEIDGGDVRLRRVREARAPPAHVSLDARPHVRPRDDGDGLSEFRAHEPRRARLPRVEEAEDALPDAVRARKHRENCGPKVAVRAMRREQLAAQGAAALGRECRQHGIEFA